METLCKFNAYCDVLLLDQFFNQYQQNTLCYHISLQKNRPYLQQLFGVGNYLKQHNMSYNIGRLFELVGEFKVAQSFYQRCVQISLTKKLVQKIGQDISNLAYVYQQQQKYDEAVALY